MSTIHQKEKVRLTQNPLFREWRILIQIRPREWECLHFEHLRSLLSFWSLQFILFILISTNLKLVIDNHHEWFIVPFADEEDAAADHPLVQRFGTHILRNDDARGFIAHDQTLN